MYKKMAVQDVEIPTKKIGKDVYISLTDIARLKNSENPADVINKWMTNKDYLD